MELDLCTGVSLSPAVDAGGGRLELNEDSVHIWLVDPSDVFPMGEGGGGEDGVANDERNALVKVLCPVELGRYEALVRGKRYEAADSFLLARALLRGTLSRYCSGVPPSDWVFTTNEHGRPQLSMDGDPRLPPEMEGLRFNLSHCPGLVCCGVALGRDVGVDAEPIKERRFASSALRIPPFTIHFMP
jgi:hypothetical protein